MYSPTSDSYATLVMKDGSEITVSTRELVRELKQHLDQHQKKQPTHTTITMHTHPHPSLPPVPLPDNCYRLQTSRLAGFSHHGHPSWIKQMQPGDPLTLVAEPANPHDHYAVRVHWQNQMIGYLPSSSNHVVSRLLRQGAPLRAVIAWTSSGETYDTPLTLHVLAPKFSDPDTGEQACPAQ